jgi:hypothetical protein
MVGNQGKHMQDVWDKRRAEEAMNNLVKERDLPEIRRRLVLEPEEEKTIRRLIRIQDKRLVTEWFNRNQELLTLSAAELTRPEMLSDIASKIRCSTEFDISEYTIKRVMKTLMGERWTI